MSKLYCLLVLAAVNADVFVAQDCVPRDYGHGSIACVCNRTYCDVLDFSFEAKPVSFTSSKSGLRFHRAVPSKGCFRNSDVVIKLDYSKKFQTVLGFGGAATDSAAQNIASLSSAASDALLASYFGPKGISYTFIRVPMASCDFSPGEYSYDDTPGDFDLKQFKLHEMDVKFKIPLIKRCRDVIMSPERRGQLKVFGSPWSAPAWMKTSKQMAGNGTLIGSPGGKYYKTWANYFVRFLQEYAKNNVSLWGLTAQNEPTSGFFYNYNWQTMGFTAEMQRDFIKEDLGPALHANGFSDVKLMILDDQRLMLPQWAKTVLSNKDAASYVSGIGVHWYMDFLVPSVVLTETHKEFPDVFLLGTEACEASMPWEIEKVLLGSWERAESYAYSIIQDLNHWFVGWTDWNMAVDCIGGPTWARNFVDSPIVVNSTAQEFYKQPMFYALGHFSKFIEPGSVRIQHDVLRGAPGLSSLVSVTAFLNAKQGTVVIVILNRNREDVSVSLQMQGKTLSTQVPALAVQTVLWPLNSLY